MKILEQLSREQAKEALRRPRGGQENSLAELKNSVDQILSRVKAKGDKALFELTEQLDGVIINAVRVHDAEIEAAMLLIDKELKKALRTAKRNIEKFHRSQSEEVRKIETSKGVTCWRESRPIESVGLYIPGGRAPLVSTVLMLGVPAILAGCRQIVLCSPPDAHGQIHPAILYAASLCGIRDVYRVGGSQAIAAMAYGTESIPKVDKIFGPGNQYVTQAKMMVQSAGTAIDMPAGPSEVLVWADDKANADFVAADLLAQAEHGPDSQAVLICEGKGFAEKVNSAVDKQKKKLSRESTIDEALVHSTIVVADRTTAVQLINDYGPEHLIIQRERNQYDLNEIQHAGSVFVGPYSPETAGDYASGTNHTLPTNGYAHMYSGVSLDSFVKKITFQELTPDGLKGLSGALRQLADAEHLDAHRNAVDVRLKYMEEKSNQ